MDSYYELFDLESGNVIEDYPREEDAIDALIQVVADHGPESIKTFALTHVKNGTPILIAMQSDLIVHVEREKERLAPLRRS